MKIDLRIPTFAVFLLVHAAVWSQGSIAGVVKDEQSGTPVEFTFVQLKKSGSAASTDEQGEFVLENIPEGAYKLIIHRLGFEQRSMEVKVEDGRQTRLTVELVSVGTLKGVDIVDDLSRVRESWLRPIDPQFAAIYAGKKTESIQVDGLNANLATNNARQIYRSIPGLNIWESDGAGLQLGIGGRGLSPNRTANFNTRQNGYDISADALGYPESYYTPPAEGLERIQIVRGAGSLQYGTQFGGMVNFVMKQGGDKPLEVVSRQTVGSWGLFNSFNSVGGTKGKLNYYAFFQYKKGEGWRPNSGFDAKTGYLALGYDFTEALNIKLEYTHMRYEAQQPGGLTDALFEQNPRQSIRDRNWFRINWNLMAATLRYDLSHNTHLNIRGFGLIAGRQALGFLGQINRTDPGGNRDLIRGEFENFGTELRFIKRYAAVNCLPSTLLVGGRYYRGYSESLQGLANDGDGPDFNFRRPGDVEGSNYSFPSRNIALFAENMFLLSERLNITPGIRFEYISTNAEGFYKSRNLHPLTGEVLFEETIYEDRNNDRNLALLGLGAGYKLTGSTEAYANVSQNYRSINFTDMQITNPNFRIDPNIRDERGYNADLGIRGSLKNGVLIFDVSGFFLRYNDRIGLVQRVDTELFNVYRLRTNVADSRTTGVESFAQLDLIKLFRSDSSKTGLTVFTNLAFIDSRYLSSEESALDNRRVELVPETTFKTGVNVSFGRFEAGFQYTFLSEQFTDATNAEFTVNAVNGLIPAYSVMDVSASFTYKAFRLEAGCNNLTNNYYFTRRAAGYPGPGIIPADGRSIYTTLQFKF